MFLSFAPPRSRARLTLLLVLSAVFTGCGPGASSASQPAAVSVAESASPNRAQPESAKPESIRSVTTSAASAQQTEDSGRALTAAYVAPIAAMAPLWMGDASGAYRRNRVNVTLRLVQANAAVNALIAHEIDALEISAAPVVTANLNGNLDLVFVAAGLNRATQALWVKPEIKTAADLRGKTLGGDRPGTPVDYGMQSALSLLGLKPTEVMIRPLGGAEAIYAALLSGQIDGGILGSPPQTVLAEEKGFRRLQDTYAQPFQNVGIVMQRSRLDGFSSLLPSFLAGYRAGIESFNENPELAKRVLREYTKEEDQHILDKTYDFYKTTAPFEASLQPTVEGLKAVLDSLSNSIPSAKTARPEQFVDTRFLAKLPQ